MKIYRLGKKYRDKAKIAQGDEFLSWINVPGSGMLNSPGIRGLKYVHMTELPLCLFKRGSLRNLKSCQFLYFGMVGIVGLYNSPCLIFSYAPLVEGNQRFENFCQESRLKCHF